MGLTDYPEKLVFDLVTKGSVDDVELLLWHAFSKIYEKEILMWEMLSLNYSFKAW